LKPVNEIFNRNLVTYCQRSQLSNSSIEPFNLKKNCNQIITSNSAIAERKRLKESP